MDNELILFDRLNVIRDIINKYEEKNFYLSFSGGKDSTVLHFLLDEAMPGNQIPRVFCNTGIEYEHIVKFVYEMQKNDKRIIIIKPMQNIKSALDKVGYPFKSKEHSHVLAVYQRSGMMKTVDRYLNENRGKYVCPKILRYQFNENFEIKVSEKCCHILKKEQFKNWSIENKRSITITAMMAEEKGLRESIKGCILTDKNGKVNKFHPLLKVSTVWENWYIKKNNISLCDLYYSPYNFKRTGCKGCPYSLDLQHQLRVMELYLPTERRQCELIWKLIYDEYRRIGYRIKNNEDRILF